MLSSRLPVMVTKLYIPRTQSHWVSRERLFQRLDALVEKKYALIIAPAGYGKSTLLAQWIEQAQRNTESSRFGWVTLDESDNDPVRFWAYLTAALPGKHTGGDFLALLHSARMPRVDDLLVLLINEIAAIPGDIFLVLDDIHVLEKMEVLSSLGFFIKNMPGNLHLILAGRAEPAIPFGNLRARGQIIEILMADLRFTLAESKQFFQKSFSLAIDDEEIRLLDERTEGWAASLELVAYSLIARSDPHQVIRSFTGSDRKVVSYLIEEIFNRQRFEIQQFLLRTSILERFCIPLCAEVLPGDFSGEKAGQLLAEIDRGNLFLVPLDNQLTWYRYHRLFSEMLQARLQAQSPSLVSDLYRRVARWFTKNQFPLDAFRYAVKVGDWDFSQELLQENLDVLIAQGELSGLNAWLETFHESFVQQNVTLCLGYAWFYLYRLEFARAEEMAVRARQLLGDDQSHQDLLGPIAVIRSTVAINFRSYPAAIIFAREALDHLDPAGRWGSSRRLVYLNLGDAYSADGNYDAAVQTYRDALADTISPSNGTVDAVIIGSLGYQYLIRGRLRETETALQGIFRLLVENQDMPAAGKALVFLSRVYIEQNRLEQASMVGRRALDACRRWNHPDHLFEALMVWAELCSLQGNLPECQQTLDAARTHIWKLKSWENERPLRLLDEVRRYSRYERVIQLFLAQLSVRDGDGQAALDQLFPTSETLDVDVVCQDPSVAGVVCAAWLTTGRAQKALALSEKLVFLAQDQHRLRREIQALWFQAIALSMLNNPSGARQAMGTALLKAQPEGYIRLFLDGGPVGQCLLQSFQGDLHPADPLSGYVAQLVLEMKSAIPDRHTVNTPYAQISVREIEILTLVADGLSNVDIAQKLVVSTNTIKTHLKRIFEKLGVNNRTEAVKIAHELGLIR